MPIYEYRCQECASELEKLQSMSADALKECPQCGASDGLKRLISQTSFVLKGSGWYATDYKSSGSPPSDSKKESDTTTAPSDSSTSTSAKSEGGSSSPTSTD